MDDSGAKSNGTKGIDLDADATGQYADDARPGGQGLVRYARPALVAGIVIAIVCVALLAIIFFLDSFNATVYSVDGKDVQDATDEARSIRESYAAARLGGTIFLAGGLALAAAGGFLLYRDRNAPGRHVGEDDEDVDFEDLAGH